MPDPRHTIDRIRALLRSDAIGADAEASSLAADLAEMCQEANDRLRRCGDFLHQGLRCEAVTLAQVHPPLLQRVADLSFDESKDWERACGALGVARPPRLALDVVTSLTDAIPIHQPLRELLSRHRLLALSHAPLVDRLAVLRQLAVADPASPIWQADIGELEKVRIVDLRKAAAAAARVGDVARIDVMLAELERGTWQSAVPADLKEFLSRASLEMHQATAVDDLRALVRQVRAAYAARSLDECRRVFAQWARIVTLSRLAVPTDLRQEILPLAHWIDEQDDRIDRERQFRVACEELAMALEARSPAEVLKPLQGAAAAYEWSLPDSLASAYRTRMDALKKQADAEKRRQLLVTIFLAAVIILALAALAFVIAYTGKH